MSNTVSRHRSCTKEKKGWRLLVDKGPCKLSSSSCMLLLVLHADCWFSATRLKKASVENPDCLGATGHFRKLGKEGKELAMIQACETKESSGIFRSLRGGRKVKPRMENFEILSERAWYMLKEEFFLEEHKRNAPGVWKTRPGITDRNFQGLLTQQLSPNALEVMPPRKVRARLDKQHGLCCEIKRNTIFQSSA